MTEAEQQPVEQATSGPGERRSARRPARPQPAAPPAPAPLAKASESELPDVHKLLGDRWAAQLNGDADGEAAASAALAELGFE